ncbi:hypothetical protein BDQ17DRAFT_1423158 [Cyathus striatus]|nr:hypothetical protein BDQ17DRAFT_1423158 [Cyathus striatus]
MPVRHLLPVQNIKTGFTTCADLKNGKLTLAKLDDKELNLTSPCPSCGAESDAPTHAWEAFYPKGSINPTATIPGGFGFYLTGPKAFVEALEGATEVVMSYRMMLQEGGNSGKEENFLEMDHRRIPYQVNDIGKENGEIELWIDGTSVMCIKELSLRESAESKIKGMHFQTFFGGHSDDWASPKDQRAWFADITGAVIA